MNFREWVIVNTPDFLEVSGAFGRRMAPQGPNAADEAEKKKNKYFLDKFKLTYTRLGNINSAARLPYLNDEDKAKLKDIIKNYMLSPKESWTGNPKQFTNAIRHNFTDYNTKMDELRDVPQDGPRITSKFFPDGCRKISLRVRVANQAYELVQGIIDHLAPEELDKQAASVQNYETLKKALAEYANENQRLLAMAKQYWPDEPWEGCPASIFNARPALAAPTTAVAAASPTV